MISVRRTASKGYGIFATTLIPQGTRLLAEKALLSITNQSPNILPLTRTLSPSSLHTLLSLSLNSTKRTSLLSLLESTYHSLLTPTHILRNRDILNIFRNNNFSLSDDLGTRSLFPITARLNHACVPNAQGNFNADLGKFTVHALRPIAEDEEVTISYLEDPLASGVDRRKRLWRGYGFECGCSACDPESPLSAPSERRRAELREKLDGYAVGAETGDSGGRREREAEVMRALVRTYEEEGLKGRELASICIAAAKLAVVSGRLGEARELAAKGMALENDAVGFDSPLYVASALAVKELRLA